jgi:hypothetical protein
MTKSRFYLRSVVAIAICLAGMMMFSGCGNDDKKNDSNGGNDGCGTMSVTLASMKQAAQDAGHLDPSTLGLEMWKSDKGYVGGIVVTFDIERSTIHIPVLEFKDKASADAVAERERKVGKYPIQNCKFLTFASTIPGEEGREIRSEQEKAFLEKLINGQPL